MLVLGIETTCDETAASVVRRSDEDGRGLRAGEGVVNANVAEIGERHRSTFCGTLV